MMEALAPYCSFRPSNDPEGDCGTTLAIAFDSAEKAAAFVEQENVRGTIPINTGKHVYTNWTPVMEKVGALNPLMDPFKMEANRNIIPDYRADMCPRTLALLASTVYISIRPEWTEEQFTERAKNLKAALIAVSR